jgi:hypothetical protein
MVMLHNGADHTTIAIHDQPARNRVTEIGSLLTAAVADSALGHSTARDSCTAAKSPGGVPMHPQPG